MGVDKHKDYIPDRGDVVWLEFNSQAGHEQAGVKPALVISPISYNKIVGLALVCPITSKVKGYPFEVLLSSDPKIKGTILADQIKSLDWKVRKIKFISKVSNEVFSEVIGKLTVLIDNDP